MAPKAKFTLAEHLEEKEKLIKINQGTDFTLSVGTAHKFWVVFAPVPCCRTIGSGFRPQQGADQARRGGPRYAAGTVIPGQPPRSCSAPPSGTSKVWCCPNPLPLSCFWQCPVQIHQSLPFFSFYAGSRVPAPGIQLVFAAPHP